MDIIEPSDVERGEWPDTTRDYVESLEAELKQKEAIMLAHSETCGLEYDPRNSMGELGPWACFHCGEVCKTKEDALRHFGKMDGEPTSCSFGGREAMIDMIRALDEHIEQSSADDEEMYYRGYRLAQMEKLVTMHFGKGKSVFSVWREFEELRFERDGLIKQNESLTEHSPAFVQNAIIYAMAEIGELFTHQSREDLLHECKMTYLDPPEFKVNKFALIEEAWNDLQDGYADVSIKMNSPFSAPKQAERHQAKIERKFLDRVSDVVMGRNL